MDQSQVFRAMMPGLTSANGARIAVAYPSFPRPLPLVRLDRRGLVFRAAGAAPLVCGLPRAATLLVADEPLCSLRLVIRDIAPAGEAAPRPSRSAAFRLPCHSDALFFADWLEYHFDELRALSQQHGPQLQLNQLERQVADDEVGVRFVYDIDGHATRHALTDCAREACAWIETEMRDKYALPVAQERFSAFAAHARAGGM
ncbi:hypothetical protein BCO9919_03780 [Burkholderia cenocepacia]|uniref:Hydroxymethylglutaryl-coenzyme A reductase family protein n=1 Tax=Burkholderia cenocepacia TaxID=95486 RepID=A0A6J5JCR1_9BURK|nr:MULTISPECIES: hypothetical protein [Burkholderia cepacia complex]CAB3969446.1 hypothetical protein BCO9919_03780 [Burkholderia cenocepacia]